MQKRFLRDLTIFILISSVGFAVVFKQTNPGYRASTPRGLFEKKLEESLNNAKEITKNSEFFSVSIKGVPKIDIEKYRLTVDGLVDNPQSFTYNDLKSLEQSVETETLTCIALISGKAVWSGIPVKTILEKAHVKKGTTEVIFYAADGYSSSIPLSDALSERVILATEMNGEILPEKHGFPLRLVYPDHYGYKWVKWITHIKVVNYDYKGYWESQGYSDSAVIKKP